MFTTSSLMLHRYMLYSASASFLSSECFIDVTQRPQGSDCVVIWVQVQGWIGERVHVKFCWGKDSGGGGVVPCTCVCVFGKLVLTQTQPLHCTPPSPVSMFEERLIAWLALISAGTRNLRREGLSPEDFVSTGIREAQVRENRWDGYYWKLWRSQLQIARELL